VSGAATPQIPSTLPPPPQGYTLDSGAPQPPETSTLPPPPQGYTIDQPEPFKYNLGPGFKPDFSTTVYATRPPEETGLDRFKQGFWGNTFGGLMDMIKGVADALDPISPQHQMTEPGSPGRQFIEGTIQAHKDEAEKAYNAAQEGRHVEAFGHALAAALPFYGPAASQVGETWAGTGPTFDRYGNIIDPGKTPDWQRALGQFAGLGTQFALPELGRLKRPAVGLPDMAPPPDAQSIIDLGKRYGITEMTPGDITQQPALKNIEVGLEKMPGTGLQSLRERQSAQIKAAAQGIRNQMWERFVDTDPSSAQALDAAAEGGDERARNVREKLTQAGNDPHRVTQASIALADWETRQTATELYDKVQGLAEQHNLGDVPMDATTKALNGSLRQLMPAKLPNKEVIRLLGDIKTSISPVLDEEGNEVSPNNSYGLIRQLHSDLGDRIREYYQGNNALIGEKGVGHLERVQNAIEDDLRDYAENSNVPELVEAGRNADQYYKTARVPFKNGMLASAATTTEPDQIFQQFIKAGKGDRAQQFYNALDDKGRAAIRYNMVNQAVEDAINPQNGIFSPQKFFTSVDKLEQPYGVFFKGGERVQIQGFKNLMAHLTRAGQYMENPPTGQRTIPFLLGGGVMYGLAHPWLLGGGAAGVGLARGLFTTEIGRNLLLKMAQVKPGTPIMESLARQAGEEVPKQTPPPAEPAGGSGAPRYLDKLKEFLRDEEGALKPTELRDLAERMVRMRKADPAAGSEQSTRVPTAVKATEDPISNVLTTGYESWKRDPEMMKKNVNAMLEYPNFQGLRKQVRSGKVSIPDAAEQIIGHIQENLQWLHDAMPEEFRDRARLWYDGANKIAKRWGGKYGATPEQVAGLMAVTSPGTDWFINAERARRMLEFWPDRDSMKWDPRMETTWRDKLSSAIPEDRRDQVYKFIQGKDFKDITPEARALWFRLHDEAINPREYHTLNPEGTWGDFARTEKGALSQFNWADFNQIEKGLSILEDGSKENIHAQLGLNHKIRNFYNNIINPNSPREHTTIDTHAVGAGLMRPISQMSVEAGQNFGGSGSSSSSFSGEKGTYGLWKEAYRRAAAANNVLPREMQSITWEAIRSLFSRKFKGSAANVDAINSLWEDVSSGKITADEARQRALKFAGGFDKPAWFRGRWDTGLPKKSGNPRQSR